MHNTIQLTFDIALLP